MQKRKCKYCGATTPNIDMCARCRENVRLIRIIKAMLRPYYNSKKAREQGGEKWIQ